MPFTLLTGTMGGGKSYYAAEVAMRCWAEGGLVHSNMDWDEQELAARSWDKLHVRLSDDPSQWQGQIVGGAEGQENLLIVDEAAMIFHTWDQMSNKTRDRELFDCLVMSRKLGLDVYFVSQSSENIAAAIRRMANFEIRCVAVKRLPLIGPAWAKFRGDFLRIQLSPKKQVLARSYARFSADVGAIYRTEALRGTAAAVQRNPTRQAQELRTPLWLKATALFVVLAIPLGFAHSCAQIRKETPIRHAAPASAPPSLPGVSTAAKATADAFVKPPGPGTAPTSGLPRLHPFSDPSGVQLDWIEWNAKDERIICARYASADGLRYYTLGGDVFTLGAVIEGEKVVRIIPQGREAFALTHTGRAFYLRTRTYQERREHDQWILERAQQPAGPPAHLPVATLPQLPPP